MNEIEDARTSVNDELDAAQAADVGGGECGTMDPYSTGGTADAYVRAYQWLVDATSEMIERIASSFK